MRDIISSKTMCFEAKSETTDFSPYHHRADATKAHDSFFGGFFATCWFAPQARQTGCWFVVDGSCWPLYPAWQLNALSCCVRRSKSFPRTIVKEVGQKSRVSFISIYTQQGKIAFLVFLTWLSVLFLENVTNKWRHFLFLWPYVLHTFHIRWAYRKWWW